MAWFVYRSPYHGVLGKHVRRLPDATVLDWFRRGWVESAPDPDAWIEAELGVEVYGLHTIFDEVGCQSLPAPATMAELRRLLKKHLYVEGKVTVDDHSVRALTDDDEVPLAYFFLDDEVVTGRPGRLTYVVHGEWPLPDEPGPPGEPRTTLAFSQIGDVDWDTQSAVVRVPGVRLPDLAAWLRTTAEWPEELTLLRGCIGPDDDLAAALDRMNRWGAWNDQELDLTGMYGDHDQAHRVALDVMEQVTGHEIVPGPLGGRRPALGHMRVADHLAQAAFHIDDDYGYQQFFCFDDVWEAGHPHLAKSLRRWFGKSWDPLK